MSTPMDNFPAGGPPDGRCTNDADCICSRCQQYFRCRARLLLYQAEHGGEKGYENVVEKLADIIQMYEVQYGKNCMMFP